MNPRRPSGVLVALLVATAVPVTAAEAPAAPVTSLTLQEALDLARAQAPAVRGAIARVDEARGVLVDASVPLTENPTLELGAGPRSAPGSTTMDVEVGLAQEFELGGQRDARIDEATAGIDIASASADEATRRILGEVAVAFLTARHADERVRIAAESEALAAEIHRVAERRYEAGDVGMIDVNLAALTLARVRAELRATEAEAGRTLDALAVLLGLEPETPIAVAGDLLLRREYDLDALLGVVGERADLRVYDAALGQAEASGRLASGARRPDLGLRVGYEREEDADIVTGGVSISLPTFQRGQGAEAVALARSEVARVERDAAEAAALAEVASAHRAYERLVDAVDAFEAEGLPLVAESEALARRGYEAGAMPLAELLAIRRELTEARITHADLLYAAALAGVELESRAGVLR